MARRLLHPYLTVAAPERRIVWKPPKQRAMKQALSRAVVVLELMSVLNELSLQIVAPFRDEYPDQRLRLGRWRGGVRRGRRPDLEVGRKWHVVARHRLKSQHFRRTCCVRIGRLRSACTGFSTNTYATRSGRYATAM